eukprot:gene15326-biopygen4957
MREEEAVCTHTGRDTERGGNGAQILYGQCRCLWPRGAEGAAVRAARAARRAAELAEQVRSGDRRLRRRNGENWCGCHGRRVGGEAGGRVGIDEEPDQPQACDRISQACFPSHALQPRAVRRRGRGEEGGRAPPAPALGGGAEDVVKQSQSKSQ